MPSEFIFATISSSSLKKLQSLTKNPMFGIFQSGKTDLEYYISYCEMIQKWAKQCNDGTTINQIENLLFRWNGGEQIPINLKDISRIYSK